MINMETGTRAVMYICDPVKHTYCSKYGCLHLNKPHGVCDSTLIAEFQADGTDPFWVRVLGTEDIESERVTVQYEDEVYT